MKNEPYIFMPTSPCPWHPSTSIIEESIQNLWGLLGEEVRVNVYADKEATWQTPEEVANYHQYLDNVRSLNVGPVTVAPDWIGLPGLVRLMIDRCDKPVLCNFQHDWKFNKPERIKIHKLLWLLRYEDDIQTVRFHKRKICPTSKQVDSLCYEIDPNKYGIELVATNGWGDSPHFSSLHHYQTKVKPNLARRRNDDARHGVERYVVFKYRRRIKRVGFERALKEWGSFIYGQFGQEGYIKHLGKDTIKWRKSKGISVNRGRQKQKEESRTVGVRSDNG